MKITKEMSEYFSMLGKRARKLHPYPKSHYQMMNKKSRAKKLSTAKLDTTSR